MGVVQYNSKELDLYEGKYTGSLPYEVGFTLEFLIKLLNFYVVPKDRYKEVDFVDTKLICQYVYKKKDIKKYKRNKKLNKFEKNNINYKKTIYWYRFIKNKVVQYNW